MSSPAARRVACAPSSQPFFPDEILEEIFVRLDAAEDLARASAACTAFHRVVSARRFLRRFRCLHPTPALGLLELEYLCFRCYGTGRFHPAKPPHRSAPAARALARAADFTFSFLVTPTRWKLCDARDGRILLYAPGDCDLMVVCDPLHRRQVRLPRIPKGRRGAFSSEEFDSFLDPATDTEEEETQDLSFRVICTVKKYHKIVTFHFSSATGKWRGITFNTPVPLAPHFSLRACKRYYAHGCCFWKTGSFMTMLNMNDNMKFSAVDLPPGTCEREEAAIVEAGEGMIGLFALSGGILQLYNKSLHGTDWHHQRIIPLPKLNSYWEIHNAAEGYLLLQATSEYFTLNLKTFLVERLCVSNRYIRYAHLYASFVSPFSLPTI